MSDHFYTTDENGELAKGTYDYEGIACYVSTTQVPGSVPFNRWFIPGDHFYTTHPQGELAPQAGYVFEGIACYVFGAPGENLVPLHRWFNSRSGDHFYTVDPVGEIAGQVGYQYEGIACYVYPTPQENFVPLFRWLEQNMSLYCLTLRDREGNVRYQESFQAVDNFERAKSVGFRIAEQKYPMYKYNYEASVSEGHCN